MLTDTTGLQGQRNDEIDAVECISVHQNVCRCPHEVADDIDRCIFSHHDPSFVECYLIM